MTFRKFLIPAVAPVLAIAFMAQAASAAEFNDERAAIWVTRTNSFVEALTGQAVTLENISPRMASACMGITGEVAKPNIPAWAQQGHLYFCHASDDIKHRYTKAICKDMKFSIKSLAKADPAKDPAAVVAAAARLKNIEEGMLTGFQEARVCH